jgi:kojibiose phosphorylase
LLPGAIVLLDELRQAGIKIDIGSGSKNAKTVIERLGIADKVDALAQPAVRGSVSEREGIVDEYNVQKPKPAPDLFLHAADQLGVSVNSYQSTVNII